MIVVLITLLLYTTLCLASASLQAMVVCYTS